MPERLYADRYKPKRLFKSACQNRVSERIELDGQRRGPEASRRHEPGEAVRTRCSTGFTRRCRRGFASTFGEPTPPQRLGWPAIASGQNCLIVAPTGSGKTLAAFLAALDHLWRTPAAEDGRPDPLRLAAEGAESGRLAQPPVPARGDPRAIATTMGTPLPALRVAVRSGDTPSHERAAMVRKPPDILITTPESLHLMLTSRAREILRGVSHVIVDEIHAVCANKRGVFLALLLERLEAINPAQLRADRPLGDAAAARRGRPVSGRNRASRRGAPRGRRPAAAGHDRRRRLAARPRSAGHLAANARSARLSRARSGRRSRTELLALVRRAPLDDHLRQQPPDGREADGRG